MAHTDRTDQLAAQGFEPYEPHPDQLDLFGPPPADPLSPPPSGHPQGHPCRKAPRATGRGWG